MFSLAEIMLTIPADTEVLLADKLYYDDILIKML